MHGCKPRSPVMGRSALPHFHRPYVASARPWSFRTSPYLSFRTNGRNLKSLPQAKVAGPKNLRFLAPLGMTTKGPSLAGGPGAKPSRGC